MVGGSAFTGVVSTTRLADSLTFIDPSVIGSELMVSEAVRLPRIDRSDRGITSEHVLSMGDEFKMIHSNARRVLAKVAGFHPFGDGSDLPNVVEHMGENPPVVFATSADPELAIGESLDTPTSGPNMAGSLHTRHDGSVQVNLGIKSLFGSFPNRGHSASVATASPGIDRKETS